MPRPLNCHECDCIFLSSLRTLTDFVNSASSNSSKCCNSSMHFWYNVLSFDASLCKAFSLTAEKSRIWHSLFSHQHHSIPFSYELKHLEQQTFFSLVVCYIRIIESESRVPSTTCVGMLIGSEDQTLCVAITLFSYHRNPLRNAFDSSSLSCTR